MTARQIARIGDSVIANCAVHGSRTGVIQTGSSIGTCDGQQIARVGDTGVLSCGHGFTIIDGSNVGDILGVRIARVDDPIQVDVGGTGHITSGCPSSDLN